MTTEHSTRFFDHRTLAFAIIVGLLTIATEAPIWIALFAFGLIAVKAGLDYLRRPAWSPWFSVFLGVLLSLEVYLRLGTLVGQDATVTLVLGLSALKVMDFRAERDKKFLILIGFVIYALKPLFTLDVYWLPPTFIGYFALWYALLERPELNGPWYLLRLFVNSLPLSLVLFFVFPRFVAPWTALVAKQTSGIGFSDSLAPGSVERIVETDELVFRVQFVGSPPLLSSNLYWRGQVMTESHGLRWERGATHSPHERLERSSSDIEYDVTLEPLGSPHAFVLEQFVRAQSGQQLIFGEDQVLRSQTLPSQRWTYRARSALRSRLHLPPPSGFAEIPTLPPLTRRWVNGVLKISRTDSDRIKHLEDFFRTQKLIYTLEPGTYSESDLDEFLFRRRKGFCEHFAGSFATLARALGIPARVIGGFQGGRFNAIGNFWRISSRDAHAWVEVYLEGYWQRIDPTALVAPDRIELGGSGYFEQKEANNLSWQSISKSVGIGDLWMQLMSRVEDVNFRWVRFMLDFSRSNQYDLLGQTRLILLLVVFAIGIWLTSSFLRNASERPKWQNHSQKLFSTLESKLARSRFSRRSDEGAITYIERLKQSFPDQSVFLVELKRGYVLENYQELQWPEARKLDFADFSDASG